MSNVTFSDCPGDLNKQILGDRIVVNSLVRIFFVNSCFHSECVVFQIVGVCANNDY